MQTKAAASIWPWMILIQRSVSFLCIQAILAALLWITSGRFSWDASAAWWPLVVILADLLGLGLMVYLYRREGRRYWDIFRIDRKNVKQDLWVMLGVLVLAGIIGYLPNMLSAQWLFGSQQVALDLLVRPLPAAAAILALVGFPILQGVVEIPTYMLYAMPHLQKQGLPAWLALSLASFCLAAQHIFIPFLPSAAFIVYRLVMFLPFAFFIGLLLHWRPRLMPYIAVMHALMNISIAAMLIPVMIK